MTRSGALPVWEGGRLRERCCRVHVAAHDQLGCPTVDLQACAARAYWWAGLLAHRLARDFSATLNALARPGRALTLRVISIAGFIVDEDDSAAKKKKKRRKHKSSATMARGSEGRTATMVSSLWLVAGAVTVLTLTGL